MTAPDFEFTLMPPCVEGTRYVNSNACNFYVNIALCINIVDTAVITFDTFDCKSEFRGVLGRIFLKLKNMCQIEVAIGVGLRGDSGSGHR